MAVFYQNFRKQGVFYVKIMYVVTDISVVLAGVLMVYMVLKYNNPVFIIPFFYFFILSYIIIEEIFYNLLKIK